MVSFILKYANVVLLLFLVDRKISIFVRAILSSKAENIPIYENSVKEINFNFNKELLEAGRKTEFGKEFPFSVGINISKERIWNLTSSTAFSITYQLQHNRLMTQPTDLAFEESKNIFTTEFMAQINYKNARRKRNEQQARKRNLMKGKKRRKSKPTTFAIQAATNASMEPPNESYITGDYELIKVINHNNKNFSKDFTTNNNETNMTFYNYNELSTSSFNEDDVLHDNLMPNSFEAEDVLVHYGSSCDRIESGICWFERQVGDTLTLAVNISGDTDSQSFVVGWRKVYRQHQKKSVVFINISSERLPWNMVWGSGGKELRLNPVTNSDMDPNSILAKVFQIDSKDDRQKYHLIKELLFRIDITFSDMGKVYFGEELNINMENFLTLPEKGNLFLEWSIEKLGVKKESLSSNVKTSSSKRSIVIKELKKNQLGVISCIVYSNGLAVAKRRFVLRKIEERARRRSLNTAVPLLTQEHAGYKRHFTLRNCRLRVKKKRYMNILKQPISRKKRFRKISKSNRYYTSNQDDCEEWRYRQRLHPRWVFFVQPDTILDSRLMPIEKLIELSEDSDGTLDDIIPREIHYVEPMVTIVTDSILENVRSAVFLPNCSIDSDCGEGAFCVIPRGQKLDSGNDETHKGYCYCLPEYFGDGFVCKKIPTENRRDKRIKKDAKRRISDWKIPSNLFYVAKDSHTNFPSVTETDSGTTQTVTGKQGGVLQSMEFEEEESYLLSSCLDRKDCSPHASCHQFRKGHPFCKCLPGYRGNGIFCWEIIDYVPADLSDTVAE